MVFVGTGAIVANDLSHGRVGIPGIGLAFGLSVFGMIYLLGSISGAHLNPAVTITLTAARKIPVKWTLFYVLSQFSGAVSASGILFYLFPNHPTLGATFPSGSATESFILEFLMSFLLVFAILIIAKQTVRTRVGPAFLIGSIVALEAIFGGPTSGASMNPARSLAPALVTGHLEHVWIYLIAPVAGGFAAFAITKATGLRSVREKYVSSTVHVA